MASRITDRVIESAELLRLKNKELAVLFGTTPQFVSECKNGRSNFTEKQVIKFLIHHRDIDAHYIIHGEPCSQASQNVTGNYNTQAGMNISGTGSAAALEMENNYLKEIIKEKEQQIKLLQKMIK